MDQRRAHKAQIPAAESKEPPTKLKRFCARGVASSWRAVLAKMAYSVAFKAASATKVMDSSHSCGVKGASALMNCGKNAMKKIMPFGFSAVTR